MNFYKQSIFIFVLIVQHKLTPYYLIQCSLTLSKCSVLTLESIRHLSIGQYMNLIFRLFNKCIEDQPRLVVHIDLTHPYTPHVTFCSAWMSQMYAHNQSRLVWEIFIKRLRIVWRLDEAQSTGHSVSPGTQSPQALRLPGTRSPGTRSPGSQSPGHSVSGHSVATPREVMAYGLTPTVLEVYSHFLQVGCRLISGEIFQGIFFVSSKFVKDENLAETT